MRTKLGELANIAEIVSAAALIISLIYVGIQVNDSASAIRASAMHDANTAVQDWYMEVGSDRQTSEVVYRALVSEEPLERTEEFQFMMMMHSFFLSMQNSYLLAKEGTLDPELRRAFNNAVRGINSLPGLQRYWQQRRSYLHGDFVAWVEKAANDFRGQDEPIELYRLEDEDRDAVDLPPTGN
ncbi:MAG: hypothetical protein R3217_00350 [Gammaproteobacteria bacterium]|nr:hypothetical protein [Gammaproteobacteria bacterium]